MSYLNKGDILHSIDAEEFYRSPSLGVVTGLTPSGLANTMQVQISSGTAHAYGLTHTIINSVSINIPSGQTNPRIDYIVFNPSSGNASAATSNSIYVLGGVASNPASPPALGVLDVPIARVSVSANAASVSSTAIADRRTTVPGVTAYDQRSIRNSGGVLSGFSVIPSGTFAVFVPSGALQVGTVQNNLSPIAFNIPPSDPNNPRIDLVAASGTIQYFTGNARTYPPTPPIPPQGIVPLATVFVDPNATTTSKAHIQDVRQKVMPSIQRIVFIENATDETLTKDNNWYTLTVGPTGSNRVPSTATHAILQLQADVSPASNNSGTATLQVRPTGFTNWTAKVYAQTGEGNFVASVADYNTTQCIVQLTSSGSFDYLAVSTGSGSDESMRVVGYIESVNIITAS